jgi:hypothetical protein
MTAGHPRRGPCRAGARSTRRRPAVRLTSPAWAFVATGSLSSRRAVVLRRRGRRVERRRQIGRWRRTLARDAALDDPVGENRLLCAARFLQHWHAERVQRTAAAGAQPGCAQPRMPARKALDVDDVILAAALEPPTLAAFRADHYSHSGVTSLPRCGAAPPSPSVPRRQPIRPPDAEWTPAVRAAPRRGRGSPGSVARRTVPRRSRR